MKTTPVRPAVHRETPRAETSKKTGAFAKAMQEAAPTPPAAPPNLPLAGVAAAETQEVRVVTLPPVLEGLVNEIATGLNAAGSNEVRIQFDAKTLDGLQVNLTRANGKLAVELNCRSAEVSRLLAHHVEGLASALQTRGYAHPTIEIRTTPGRAAAQQDRRENSQEQGGGQHRGRQR